MAPYRSLWGVSITNDNQFFVAVGRIHSDSLAHDPAQDIPGFASISNCCINNNSCTGEAAISPDGLDTCLTHSATRRFLVSLRMARPR